MCAGRCAMCAISLAFHKSIKLAAAPDLFLECVRALVSFTFCCVVLFWSRLTKRSQYLTGIVPVSVKLFLRTINDLKLNLKFYPQHCAEYRDKLRRIVNVLKPMTCSGF